MPDNREALVQMAKTFGIPGLSIAIYADGHAQNMCLGEDAAGSGRTVTDRSWFQAASTGKHVTAAAILDLEKAGLIRLNETLGSFLPDAPSAWQDRTIASMLNHTSGLPEYLAYVAGEDVPAHRADFMVRYARLEPIANEGAAWGYSNTNYILLGFIIAAVTGDSYTVAVQRLFEAADVTGATVASPDWVRRANADPRIAAQGDVETASREVIGDGDIAFCTEGAGKWLRFLSAKADARLFEAPLLASGRRSPYGCGWFVEEMGHDALAHHAGHYDGWTAMAFLNRSQKAGVLAMCNLAPGNTRAIRAIAQTALEAAAPGSTPLGLKQIKDAEPDLSAMIRAQMIRRGAPVDRTFFAPELQTAIDKGGPIRGVLDLWCGEEPSAFFLVEEQQQSLSRMRRYRIVYGDRTEHLLVGLTENEKVYWAWPL
jgi:D-alanyl-D-alanine carboxypeptidase